MKLPDLFRPRVVRERDSYISSSLAASNHLSRRLADWSSNTSPKNRLLAMNFDKVWRHPGCLVMEWYKTHQTTTFTSIQHWRNVNTQFYHEFLIIQLTDGSACRLERMGEGLRTDAIRRTGCTAYDLIQWFSPKDHLSKIWSTGLNEMIAQVDFPCTFDLFDILSICHTIQHGSKKASVYTLQRYNCYFLCCAVLAILARRLEAWEKLISRKTWVNTRNKAFNELRGALLIPIHEQSPVGFFALGICSLISPDCPRLAEFLLDTAELSLDWTDANICGAFRDLLWHEDLDVLVMAAVTCLVLSSAQELVSADDIRRSAVSSRPTALDRLNNLLGEVNEGYFSRTEHDLASMDEVIPQEFLTLCSVLVAGIVDPALKTYQMRELEVKTSPYRRVTASALGRMAGSTLFQPMVIWFTEHFMDGLDAHVHADDLHETLKKFSVTLPQLALAVPSKVRSDMTKLLVYARPAESESSFGFEFVCRFWEMMFAVADQIAGRMHVVLLERIQTNTGELNIPAGLAWLNSYLSRFCWKLCYTRIITQRFLGNLNHHLEQRNPAKFTIHSADGSREVVTVADFQGRIQERIRKHAQRVESFQLAAAPLVCNDIKDALAEIWTLLPEEHRESKAELEAEEDLDGNEVNGVFTIPFPSSSQSN